MKERESIFFFGVLEREAAQMNSTSFETSRWTTFVIFVILTILLFPWLSRRPGNNLVYYPNWKLKGLPLEGGSRTRNPFAWIPEALSSTENEVISTSGVDTAVYFVFLSTGLFLSISLQKVSWN